MKRKEHLKILGLNDNASAEEIKKAYRKESLRWHPDKNNNSQESTNKFNKLNEAFSYLTNKNGEQDEEKIFEFPGMNGSAGIHPQDIFNMMFNNGEGLESLFNNDINDFNHPFQNVKIFHNGRPVNMKKEKPPPIMITVNISMEQCYTGCKLPVTVNRWIGKPNMNKEDEKIYVDIPCGIDNNEMIIVKNKGHIANDNLRGDVKIIIKVSNDTNFKREGLDLILEKNITLKEALCGFIFTIEHINGKTFTLKNNKIIKPGNKTNVQKLGFKRENIIGNLIIEFNVNFPNELSSDIIKQLKKLL